MDINNLENLLTNVFKATGLYNEEPKIIRNGIESHFKSLNFRKKLDGLEEKEIINNIHEYTEGFVNGYFQGKRDKIWEEGEFVANHRWLEGE